MKRTNHPLSFFIALSLLLIPSLSFATGSGTYSFTYFGNTKEKEEVYYKEHFMAYDISNDNWSYHVDFRGQSQDIPHESFITLKDNFQTRAHVSYEKDPYTVTFGHFYANLGRGLTFNGFENRAYRLDKNTLGLYGEYDGDRWGVKAFKGNLNTNSSLNTRVPVMGSELRYQVSDTTALGGTIVAVEDDFYDYSAHSGFIDYNQDQHSLYLEYAKSNDFGSLLYGDDDDNSYAFYAAHELSIDDTILTSQYKDYYHFELNYSDGVALNQLPTVLKEHNYTLIARSQSDLDYSSGYDEKGFLLELDTPIQDTINTHFSYGTITTTTDSPKLKEYYAELDYDSSESFDIVYGIGLQEQDNKSNTNHILDMTYSLSDSKHIQGILEHQRKKFVNLTFEGQDEKLVPEETINLAYTIKYIPSSDFSIGFVLETTDGAKSGERSDWFGTQMDMKLSESSELSLFYGARKAGKSCIGGVCIYKPEFDGLEIGYSAQF